MNVLVVLIPVSLTLGAVGLIAFLWTVKSEQYDDSAGNAARILLGDETENSEQNLSHTESTRS